MPQTPAENTSAAGRYETLSTDRQLYLDRARAASRLTIPSLVPPEGFSKASDLYQPYQSVGARGVNTLANKLVMTLLPPNAPFFRLLVDPATADKMNDKPDFKTEIEAALAKYEKAVMTAIEGSTDRVALFEALKHLLVAGNILLFLDKQGTKVFHLDKYVVKRDPRGDVLEIVVKECIAVVSLPDEIKQIVAHDASKSVNTVDVYTHIVRKPSQWYVYQEVCGQKVPGSDGQYPLDKTPWLPLRLIRIDGEDYGRGYVEEYIGDLNSLEELSKAITEASAAAAKILFLVKPNGTTDLKTLQDSDNLDIRSGNAEDVTVLQVEKYADLKVAEGQIGKLEQRLSYAFLMQSAIQRNAERVTAEEIRYMAGELEQALGGVYGILSVEFQIPYLNRKIAVLNRAGELPVLSKKLVKISIVTGIEALGRGDDRNKLVEFIGTIAQALGPEAVAEYIDIANFISRLAASDGIDPDGLVKTQDQIMQDRQQQMTQQLAQQATPEVIKQAGSAFANAAQGQNEQGQQPAGS